MEKQRKITDLSKDEICQIVTDIFEPKRISDINYNQIDEEVYCKIYKDWTSSDGIKSFKITELWDNIVLRNPFEHSLAMAINATFPTTLDDIEKLKQFCFTKGVYGKSIEWLINNPYKKEDEISDGLADNSKSRLKATKTLYLAGRKNEEYIWYPDVKNQEDMLEIRDMLLNGHNTVTICSISTPANYRRWKDSLINRENVFADTGFSFNDINLKELCMKGYIVLIRH